MIYDENFMNSICDIFLPTDILCMSALYYFHLTSVFENRELNQNILIVIR